MPNSARRYQAWWANQSNSSARPQAASWMEAGWRTSDLDLSGECVTFIRTVHQVGANKTLKAKTDLDWSDVIIDDGSDKRVDMCINCTWRRIGEVRIDHKMRLEFPPTPLGPAVYRFSVRTAQGKSLYVGEAEEISRRLQHYRTPGPTQQTNRRLNTIMIDCLEADGVVSVDILLEASLKQNGIQIALDLTNKNQRRLLEHAAMVDEHFDGTSLLNR